jgi:hypothetical protein
MRNVGSYKSHTASHPGNPNCRCTSFTFLWNVSQRLHFQSSAVTMEAVNFSETLMDIWHSAQVILQSGLWDSQVSYIGWILKTAAGACGLDLDLDLDWIGFISEYGEGWAGARAVTGCRVLWKAGNFLIIWATCEILFRGWSYMQLQTENKLRGL